ncbi:hypothetical protein [uncultured Ornithinimicrobium sp.]|uniref:hypothetical protein n=1 Tax=uncultured Ornithinimicrobium sp. TaxID=259307 RepID=UPI0025980FB1|nr:hypothetical protein [uncultured Ornithinimicrobium sp.]
MSPDHHRSFHRQAALGLDGFQEDLFDIADDLDGVDLAAAEEVAQENGLIEDGLFPLDQSLPGTSRYDRNPALRLLESPLRDRLTRRDDAKPGQVGGADGSAQIETLIRLEAAGHALLVASTIEREIRRCERAARAAQRGGGAPTTALFLRELSEAPHPWHIKEDGLRLVSATNDAEGRLVLVMSEPKRAYLSLARWPRLTMAFATAAIADRYLSFIDESGWETQVELPTTRLKAIAGGIPHGGVEVYFRNRNVRLKTGV